MREDDYPEEERPATDPYPQRVSDPEAAGLPDTADDDSTAWDDVHSPRESDGPDPAGMSTTGPQGAEHWGTTPEEQLHGEPLDMRLAEEEPDVQVDDPLASPPPGLAGETLPEENGDGEEAELDADVWQPSPESDPDSQVSLYDRPDVDYGHAGEDSVGRLVAPDQGGLSDEEADAVASDEGAAGGGASAEETAIHEIPDSW
ncbi:MAG TPA: DUF5709 domain-containing protein [Micromonosporaceae bacterium]